MRIVQLSVLAVCLLLFASSSSAGLKEMSLQEGVGAGGAGVVGGVFVFFF